MYCIKVQKYCGLNEFLLCVLKVGTIDEDLTIKLLHNCPFFLPPPSRAANKLGWSLGHDSVIAGVIGFSPTRRYDAGGSPLFHQIRLTSFEEIEVKNRGISGGVIERSS